ncbi:cyanophycin synthetase [Leptothrix cholodnii SP-6]|uniref:Cyanophycin synthetase n=1 Tax=Leptothrix cholodnii (strain ATCC 51168 / LMG 8142 / SP-6) TaxID=395495 RepID=B1XWU4_LEPCP|nr:cyanophycin synthetase [Leptothrix cholodnii]ACB36293.1 cyanophycin synthetase [Leptothrix cholodnii SP-6]
MSLKEDIKLLRINYLRGPNVWTYRPVLEVWLDLGELEDHPSHLLPGFNDRLTAMLPALVEHHCGVGERGGFLQRLQEGTWMGHVLEHVVIELLNLSGMPTGFGQTRSTSRRGVYRMVFRARDEQVARTALANAHALLMAAINDQPFDVDAAVTQVRERIDECFLGPSTACIVAAATDRRIPHIRLNDGNLVQLGYGSAQRRIWTAETDLTSAIAEGIAGDKDLTKALLRAVGVPVPEGQVAADPAAAWEIAQDIGLPVVVKPTDANHGRGVSLDLGNRQDVESAWGVARAEGSEVIVERYVRGDEHRVLVVDGQVVAAARGESLWITGDGHGSVVQLIDSQLNIDPRRGDAEEFPLETIRLDREPVIRLLLERQGLDGTSVPEAGRRILIQRNGNVSIDCTDQVHPEVEHAVSLAARVIGLDIAGVDLVCEDISRPLQEQGGAIVEVNAGPGLLMHLKPAEGTPRPVGQAIVNHLFAEDASGRIPIVGIAGSVDTHRIARLVAWLVHLSGRHVGLACGDGLFLGNRQVERRDGANWSAGHRLLINREVQAVVLENGAASILQDGLAYDRCQVGVITDLGGAEALAAHDIQTSDQLVRVLRTQMDVVLSDGVGVLNAADERIAELASLCDGEVLLYADDGQNAALREHRGAGGRAVFLRDRRLVLATGTSETLGPPLHSGRRRGAALSAGVLLAAVATAWGLGIAPELIAAGIETFDPDLAMTAPGQH